MKEERKHRRKKETESRNKRSREFLLCCDNVSGVNLWQDHNGISGAVILLNLDTSESSSEIPGKFWSMVLEKNWEDRLDQSCEKWGSITYSQGGEEHPTYNKKTEG